MEVWKVGTRCVDLPLAFAAASVFANAVRVRANRKYKFSIGARRERHNPFLPFVIKVVLEVFCNLFELCL